MTLDPDTLYLGEIAAASGSAYVLSSFVGASYEITRQKLYDIDDDINQEVYQELLDRGENPTNPESAALAFFDLGRKEVLEKELDITPKYGQKT